MILVMDRKQLSTLTQNRCRHLETDRKKAKSIAEASAVLRKVSPTRSQLNQIHSRYAE